MAAAGFVPGPKTSPVEGLMDSMGPAAKGSSASLVTSVLKVSKAHAKVS